MSDFQIYENKTSHLLTNSVLTLKNQTNRNSHMYISNIMQQVEIPEHSQTKIVVDNCSICCWAQPFTLLACNTSDYSLFPEMHLANLLRVPIFDLRCHAAKRRYFFSSLFIYFDYIATCLEHL